MEVGEVMRAQGDVTGRLSMRAEPSPVRVGAPIASQLGSLALDVLAQRFHLGEKAAQVFEVASGFSSHGPPLRMSKSSTGVTHTPVRPVFDARM